MATYECQVVQERSGDIIDDVIVNVLHIDEQGAPHSILSAETVALQCVSLWNDDQDGAGAGEALRTFQYDDVRLTQVRVYRAGEQGLPILVHTPLVAITGTQIGTPLPPQVAATITFRNNATGGPGRQGSRWGRMYLGGLTTNMLAAPGRIQTLQAATLANQFAGWNTSMPAGFKHVVFSRTDGTARPITTYVCDNIFDTMRSRRYQQATARTVVQV